MKVFLVSTLVSAYGMTGRQEYPLRLPVMSAFAGRHWTTAELLPDPSHLTPYLAKFIEDVSDRNGNLDVNQDAS